MEVKLHPAMQAALAAADQALGRTSPNPPVGAAVWAADTLISTGWTQPPGGPHAEVVALQTAGSRARGAELYVTLEPCTIWGRTPPCTDAIVAAGIRRVVIASRDPNPRFERDAASVLQAAGIEVAFDPAAQPHAEVQTEAFRRWITTKRPFVSVKYAMTLDGKIATYTGDSRWITSPPARQRVHAWRDQVDAILVGVGTLLADDPLLTTRIDQHWRPVRHPLRVIVDAHGRTPASAAMLQPAVPGTTVIATTAAATPVWRASIANAEIIELPANPAGQVELGALLDWLGQHDITSLMVEGGGTIIASFLAAGLIDKLLVWIAPKLIGGASAPTPVGGPGIALMQQAHTFTWQQIETIGPDLLAVAYPVR